MDENDMYLQHNDERKAHFGTSNVSLKNPCNGKLNKMLYINKFPLVLSTLFRTVIELKEKDVISSKGRDR